MFSNHFITFFFIECSSGKILRIGQYLAKIWTKLCGLLFWATLYLVREIIAISLVDLRLYKVAYADYVRFAAEVE